DAASGRLLQRPVQYGSGPDLGVAVERAAKERLLVTERRIKAGPVDAHRLGEIGQRCSFEPPLPENNECLVQRLVGIEFSRATLGHHLHLFSLCRHTIALSYSSVQITIDTPGVTSLLRTARYTESGEGHDGTHVSMSVKPGSGMTSGEEGVRCRPCETHR